MPNFLGDVVSVLLLIFLGAALGRLGFLTETVVDGFKNLIASVSLPALLFMAFSKLHPQGEHFILALLVFSSCGALGLVGAGLSKAFRLPSPSTRFLFQGFEAGMLGYALFSALLGRNRLAAFAAADLGQVLFVFTVLMAQLRGGGEGVPGAASQRKGAAVLLGLLRSPVIIAILAGLIVSFFSPSEGEWAPLTLLGPTFDLIGGVTTPLVCLVVGFGLRDGLPGFKNALATVALRLLFAGALGSFLAFVVVPHLGLPRIVSTAVLALFVLPPPFVIPVFRKKPDEATYVSSVLSLHTLLSLFAFLGVAAFLGGAQ